METLINDNLEAGEELLWYGGSASDKVWDKTNRLSLLLKFIISFGIAAVLMVYAVRQTGDIKLSVFLFLLVIGSMVPLGSVGDGLKAKKLTYAATDRRLLKANESMLVSAYYNELNTCAFRKDQDGRTSLLCGDKALKASPFRWRSLALFGGIPEKDRNNRIKSFLLYAVDDPAGLKAAIEDKLDLTD